MASGIQIGDAVLKMFVDWTDIDKVASDLPSHLKPGSDAAAALGKTFDVVGSSAAAAGTQASLAGKKIGDAGKQGAAGLKSADEASQGLVARIKALEAESVVLQQQVQQLQVKLQQLGPAGEEAGRRMGRGMNEAAAEAGLLGEAFGIRLPRHVRTFISELPGLSTALSAAFSATAIFFIIEAVVQLGEKITELLEHSKKVEEAWKDVGTASISAGQAMSRAVDESEAKLIGLTEGALAELDFRIRNIAEDSKAAAGEIGKIGDAVTNALTEEQANAFAVAFFAGFKDTSREVAEDAKKFFKQLKDTVDLDGSAKGLEKISQKFVDLDVQMKETAKDLKETGSPAQSFFDEDRLKALERFRNGLINVQHDLEKDQSRILLDQTAKAAQQAEEADQSRASNAVRLAKEVLDVRLAAIESTKANEEAAFAEGKINITQWAEAQIKAANDSAAAQIRYKAAIALSAQQSLDAAKAEVARADAVIRKTDTEAGHAAVQVANEKLAEAAAKAHQAAEELANEKLKQQSSLIEAAAKAIAKSKDEAAKLREEWSRQDFGAKKVEDATHALDELTRAEQRLRAAQTALREVEIAKDFIEQERAIQALASLGVLTEQQKAQRLRQLYAQEGHDALAALTSQLISEREVVTRAREQFNSAKDDPFFPEAQLADLKRKLDEAETVYTTTRTRIVKTQQEFEDKQLTQQRGYFAQALNLALAAGERQIAEQLRLKQHELDETRVQIEQAKARGENTKKLQEQEREIQRTIRTIGQEVGAVGTLRRAWDIFSQDYKKKTTDDEAYALQLAQSMQIVAQGLQDGIEGAFEAMVSGSESAGQALEAAAFSTIGSIAQQWGAFFLAKAIGDLWINPAASAGEFAAGAALEALAGVMKGLSGAIGNTGTSSGSSSAGTAGPEVGSTAAIAAPQPIQVQNDQHFARGALITKKMRAVIGDGPGGGDAPEGIIPLNDDRATSRIADALFKPLIAAFAGVPVKSVSDEMAADIVNPQLFTLASRRAAAESVQINQQARSDVYEILNRLEGEPRSVRHEVHNYYETHNHIKGDLVDYKQVAAKVSKPLSDGVKSGKFRLASSTAFRQTKRG